jgi:DNA-binding transcriptional LysR family regulator
LAIRLLWLPKRAPELNPMDTPWGQGKDSISANKQYTNIDEQADSFITYHGFHEAFRVADFSPNVMMTVGDIFSLMNLVSAGMGYTLLPGRVRDVSGNKLQLIPLKPEYLMRQTIGVSFLRVRERDPDLLALVAVCRMLRHDKK